MNTEAGPITALVVALTVAVLYTQGGIFQAFAGLIILAVLISRVGGQPSIAEGLITEFSTLVKTGFKSGE